MFSEVFTTIGAVSFGWIIYHFFFNDSVHFTRIIHSSSTSGLEDETAGNPRKEKVFVIADARLLLKAYTFARIAVGIFVIDVIISLLAAQGTIEVSPFINECRIWVSLAAGLVIAFISVFLLLHGIAWKPVGPFLMITIALFGNAALYYFSWP